MQYLQLTLIMLCFIGDYQLPAIPVNDNHFMLVLDGLKNGISVMQLVETMRQNAVEFPTASQLYDYANANSERKSLYMYAREQCTHAMADQVVQIADTVMDPQRARNMINARQWVASKINSKNYGDKLDVSVEQKIDISVAVNAARARLDSMRNSEQNQMIDITPEEQDIDPYS